MLSSNSQAFYQRRLDDTGAYQHYNEHCSSYIQDPLKLEKQLSQASSNTQDYPHPGLKDPTHEACMLNECALLVTQKRPFQLSLELGWAC